MRYLYAALGLLTVACAPARAQVGFGPEVGLNISNYTLKENGTHINSAMKVGGTVGAAFDIQLSNNLYLQPSVLWMTNGYKLDFKYSAGTSTYTGTRQYMLYSLESPVMITYKFATPGCNRFFVGAGPFVSYNWDGAMRTKADMLHINSRSDIPLGSGATDEVTRWDVGARIVGGYQLAEGLYARVHAQMSGLNLRPEQYHVPNSLLRNYNFGISVGYLFGNKNRVKTRKVKVSESATAAPQPPANPANAANPANPQTPAPPATPNTPKPPQQRFDR